MLEKKHAPLLADLLMGAAYADMRLRGQEVASIRGALASLLETEIVPSELEQRLRHFDPARFDLEHTVRAFGGVDQETVRAILEAVADVHASDGELDLDEDSYLRRLAKAFGFPEDKCRDLLLEIATLASVKPPPVPDDA